MKTLTKLTVLLLLAATAVAAGPIRYATTALKVRSTPGTDGDLVTVLKPGTPVEVVGEEGEEVTISGAKGKWLQIRHSSDSHTQFYAFGGFLSQTDPLADTLTRTEAVFLEDLACKGKKGKLGCKLKKQPPAMIADRAQRLCRLKGGHLFTESDFHKHSTRFTDEGFQLEVLVVRQAGDVGMTRCYYEEFEASLICLSVHPFSTQVETSGALCVKD
ncbi:SH3 domain-containing protein [Turneriella parva]|uniref:SH3 type 3 domain protein n=1 Tax=Turneriella parva (strain ATCC BAA-1111 / DSM 21527 / NCTC 11395 / H) TaxID=869212 RepID=I4B0E1_TURPD|nr:SH3 domain-containing protein [Turneriella parva]AFM10748.1 SH3 type 3 domain protein [Turneriella parva DSM 21527]